MYPAGKTIATAVELIGYTIQAIDRKPDQVLRGLPAWNVQRRVRHAHEPRICTHSVMVICSLDDTLAALASDT